MYDGLTGRYTFACPVRGEVRVRLSRFLALARLPGAAHPSVYEVTFACDCGSEHEGLVTHDELDWAPLAGPGSTFLNLMTDRLEDASPDLLDAAARRIQAGQWPWSFFCYPEERPQPVFPSAFRLLAGGAERDEVGLAVECPACTRLSVNLVSPEHVDVPFYNDRRVGVVEHAFRWDAGQASSVLRERLFAGTAAARRRDLAA
ncbi:MAG: hypothetical protein ACRDNI_09110 [Gaiellaceae bacterium]